MIITSEEFGSIMKQHDEWLVSNGEKGRRADFRGLTLPEGADLSHMDLSMVDFNRAGGTHINFEGSILRDVLFTKAMFHKSNFQETDLSCSSFAFSDFETCDFSEATVKRTDFFGCTFVSCKFANVTPCGGQGLPSFERAEFINTIDPPHLPLRCPKVGSFVGWKKCWAENIDPVTGKRKESRHPYVEVIVKLLIPAKAARTSGSGCKCRCNEALVLDIRDLKGNAHVRALSHWNMNFVYKVGESVFPDGFEEDPLKECGHGIHFFLERDQAVYYKIV